MGIELLIAAALVLVATLVSTASGFGLATIMIPVLLMRYPLPETLLFVGVIHLMADVWKLWFFRQGVRWRLVLTFAALGVPATVLGAWLVPHLPQAHLSRALGGFILAYVVFLAMRPTLRVRPKTTQTMAGGAAYGFFAGIFGISGEIRSAILSSYDLPKSVFLFTNGAIALLVDTARIGTYVASGTTLLSFPLWGIAFLLPFSLVGALLAKRVVGKIPQNRYRPFVAAFLLLAGLKLLLWP